MGFTIAIPWLLLSFQAIPSEMIDPWGAVLLATQLRNQRKLTQAETTLLKALATVTRSGPEGVQAATILNELALVYQDLDRYAKAEECFQRSLRAWDRVCGPEGPCVVRPLVNLASLYIQYGQLAKADRIGRRLLRIPSDEPPGDRHVPMLLRNLAGIHYARGRYSQAEPLLQRALRLLEQTGGDADRGELALTLHDLGAVYSQRGRHLEALSHVERALEIWKWTSDKRNLTRGLKNLAVVYGMTGRRAEAEAHFLKALALADSSFEPTHPFMEEALSDYAYLLRRTGRKAEAKELEKRAQTIREKHAPRDDRSTIDINALRAGKK